MSTIGIFGDSFATDEDSKAWPNHLKQDFDVTTYAIRGISPDWIYQQFVTQHANYDQVVVFLSNVSRIGLYNIDYERFVDIENFNDFDLDIAELAGLVGDYHDAELTSEKILLNRGYKNPLKYTRTLNAAYREIWTQSSWANIVAYHAMLTAMQSIRPDVKIINSFPFGQMPNMLNLSDLDCSRLNSWCEIKGQRINHMSIMQNEQFAGYMKQMLTSRFDIKRTLHTDVLTKFYTPSKTLKEAGLRDEQGQ